MQPENNDLTECLSQIDRLQSQIDSAGEYSDEIKKRINYRFRLDWNFYSNSIEGNTLTKEETRSVMVGNITVGKKPFKDVAEMRGHDEVISEILKVGRGEKRLSERRIKDIHRAIMHEEDEAKRRLIGRWKEENNEVINYKGEKHEYIPPAEVAEKLHELLNEVNAFVDVYESGGTPTMHPAQIAIWFHLGFVNIHPFYDGNGRSARILMNLLLIAFGYPPVIVKDEDKEAYNKYLADIQGYGGSPDLFYGFMLGLLKRSQILVLDAIAGKPLDEEEDLDKEIELMKHNLARGDQKELIARSNPVIERVFESSVLPILKGVHEKVEKLSDMFASLQSTGTVNGSNRRQGNGIDEIEQGLKANLAVTKTFEKNTGGEINEIQLTLVLTGFKLAGLNTFSIHCIVTVRFGDFKFEIRSDSNDQWIFLYSEPPGQQEQQAIVGNIVRSLMKNIQQQRDRSFGQ